MSERGIKRLKQKFMTAAMMSLLLVMILLGGTIYSMNAVLARNNIREILNYIVENEGELPGTTTLQGRHTLDLEGERSYNVVRFLSEIFGNQNLEEYSAELHLSTRYFVVFFDDEENVDQVKSVNVDSITEKEAATYGRIALKSRRRYGRIGGYYYQVSRQDDGGSLVVYLDGSYQLTVTDRLLYSALVLIGLGFLVALLVVKMVAERAIQPEIRNAELQKQFITNASHELKTPLAVIKANTEMQEILEGETEWTQSTLRQTERLLGLIQNLVMITRVQEREGREEALSDTDVSKSVKETAETFVPVALQAEKEMKLEIPGGVHMMANDSEIRQLTSLLVDNAIKYCDPKGCVNVSLAQKGRGILLVVSNDYAKGKDVDYSRFFERFYREDQSHNTDTGGYGIGLSIAENLVTQYKGKIQVSWKDGVIYFSCVLKNGRN